MTVELTDEQKQQLMVKIGSYFEGQREDVLGEAFRQALMKRIAGDMRMVEGITDHLLHAVGEHIPPDVFGAAMMLIPREAWLALVKLAIVKGETVAEDLQKMLGTP